MAPIIVAFFFKVKWDSQLLRPPSTHAQICGGQLIACAGGLGQAGSLSAVGILVFLVFIVAVKDMCFF